MNNFSASYSRLGASEGPVAIAGERDERFNWGPFLRVKVPFGN
jgi:hypothetical protein